MSTLLTCDDGVQPDWCPASADDVLPSVLGSLPPGPAWDGDRQPGTTKYRFWTAISDITAWVYGQLCAYEKEFFCDTADLSLDQWIKAWALGQNCDPFGYNLCDKVTALGGQSCEFFTDLALKSGWVITCRSLAKDPEPIAGCFFCGCTPLGPTPVLVGEGSNLGYGALCTCDYGEVVHHPNPEFWQSGNTAGAPCPVPGSNLGFVSGDPDCCFICGYYTLPDPALYEPSGDACVDLGVTITFPKTNTSKVPDLDRGACDGTGRYSEYGLAYLWQVTIDLPASYALQNIAAPSSDEPSSSAGSMIAGCTSICAPAIPDFIICLLQSIAPAHTELLFEVIQP